MMQEGIYDHWNKTSSPKNKDQKDLELKQVYNGGRVNNHQSDNILDMELTSMMAALLQYK